MSQIAALRAAASAGDDAARLVLADALEEQGLDSEAQDERDRAEILRMVRADELPTLYRKKRIESLSTTEKALMPSWVEKWVKIGLDTRSADRALFEAGATACYRRCGLAAPRFAWCESPIVAVSAGAVWCSQALWSQIHSQVHSQVRSQVDSQVYSQVYSQVDSQVHSQVRSQVHSQLDSQVYSQVGSQVRSQVHSQVHSQIHSQVGSQVDSQVDSQVGSQVRSQVDSQVRSQVDSQVGSQVHSQVYSQVYSQVGSQVHSQVDNMDLPSGWRDCIKSSWTSYMGGQFWVGWWYGNAALMYYLDAIGLDIGSDLELGARAYSACAISACWWYPTKDVVFVSERPREIVIEGGKLVRASWDGWSVSS